MSSDGATTKNRNGIRSCDSELGLIHIDIELVVIPPICETPLIVSLNSYLSNVDMQLRHTHRHSVRSYLCDYSMRLTALMVGQKIVAWHKRRFIAISVIVIGLLSTRHRQCCGLDDKRRRRRRQQVRRVHGRPTRIPHGLRWWFDRLTSKFFVLTSRRCIERAYWMRWACFMRWRVLK